MDATEEFKIYRKMARKFLMLDIEENARNAELYIKNLSMKDLADYVDAKLDYTEYNEQIVDLIREYLKLNNR